MKDHITDEKCDESSKRIHRFDDFPNHQEKLFPKIYKGLHMKKETPKSYFLGVTSALRVPFSNASG